MLCWWSGCRDLNPGPLRPECRSVEFQRTTAGRGGSSEAKSVRLRMATNDGVRGMVAGRAYLSARGLGRIPASRLGRSRVVTRRSAPTPAPARPTSPSEGSLWSERRPSGKHFGGTSESFATRAASGERPSARCSAARAFCTDTPVSVSIPFHRAYPVNTQGDLPVKGPTGFRLNGTQT